MLYTTEAQNTTMRIYKHERGRLTKFVVTPQNHSINGIIQSLGFNLSQIHVVNTFDSSRVECIGFKILSKEAVFIVLKDQHTSLSLNELYEEIKAVDWDYEYSSHIVEDILNEGVGSEDLTLDFLKSVMSLEKEGGALYYSADFGLYLTFKDGFLESFSSSEWLNTDSKWLRDLNEKM